LVTTPRSGIAVRISPDVLERIRSPDRTGHRREAIRELRIATNCSLEQAKAWLNDTCRNISIALRIGSVAQSVKWPNSASFLDSLNRNTIAAANFVRQQGLLTWVDQLPQLETQIALDDAMFCILS
jgi:hypothetical protein